LSYDAIARIAWKQAGADRDLAAAAFEELGGDPATLPFWLPEVWAAFGAQGQAGDIATAIGDVLDIIDPTAAQPDNPVTALETCAELLGTGETAAMRAALATTTLGGGYGGDAANDQLALIMQFLAANLPQ
jgi:hypothetical protein